MERIEKGTWYSRVEDILCRDFGNVYSKSIILDPKPLDQTAPELSETYPSGSKWYGLL